MSAIDSTTMINGGLRTASTLSSSSSSSPLPQSPIPPEIEATLSRLSAYRNVKGVMIQSRKPTAGGKGGILQSRGAPFEGEGGMKYAMALEGVVEGVANAVGDRDEGDELKFMRIRTKRHELIITVEGRYLLVVLQDPGQ